MVLVYVYFVSGNLMLLPVLLVEFSLVLCVAVLNMFAIAEAAVPC
jgi:hypothetical protein